VQALVHILDRSYHPRFHFQSTVYGRGSGANTDGTVAGGVNGLGLERANWAAGITVSFPLFDIFSIHARKQIELSNERAETAGYDQTIQELTRRLEQARVCLEAARRVAQETPVGLRAVRDTETQARARYQAGLATIVDPMPKACSCSRKLTMRWHGSPCGRTWLQWPRRRAICNLSCNFCTEPREGISPCGSFMPPYGDPLRS